MRRLLAVSAAVLAALVLFAAPAGADPARPTDYLSVMTAISPPTPYATLRVVGGDGFLDLSVARGHTAVVQGYEGEPYLRVLRTGVVQVNRNSPAYYLNKSRYGTTPVPAALEGSTLPPPAWKTSGHHGHAVWHDHRIHFMAHTPTQQLAEGLPVFWSVNFTVDGVAHVARGNYRLLHGPETVLWLALIVVVAGLVWLSGRRSPVLVASIAAVVAAPIGLVLGWNQNAVVPKAAGGTPLIVILPVLSLIGGLVGIVKHKQYVGGVAVLAAVACEGGWFLSRTSVLWKAVIPTRISAGIDRTGSSILIGLALGAAIVAVRSGAISRTARTTAHPIGAPEHGAPAEA